MKAIGAGLCIAASVPPWGFWPLAFVGIALLASSLKVDSATTRFKRGALFAASWFFPAMLWMFDMAPPGYFLAVGLMSAMFGIAAALATPERQFFILPGLVAGAELLRWSWPFGGVPLANLALSQVESPLVYVARLFGPLGIVVAVCFIGVALLGLRDNHKRSVMTLIAVAVLSLLGYLHSPGEVTNQATIALVQGGGEQNTRASAGGAEEVLQRHVDATKSITEQVDLILWPENVVNPRTDAQETQYFSQVSKVAAELQAPISAGWFLSLSDTETVNYQSIITPSGEETARYDKVRTVPFGEFVPFRSLIEIFSSEVPTRDVRPGVGPATLKTPIGLVGSQISWEGYFDNRARSAINEGAQLLTNPTNGSSYWLTQVQTQQVAANQVSAVAYNKYVLQAAPTGLTAVISPDGEVLQRTDVSEQKVLIATVELLDGKTIASRLEFWPGLLYALIAAGLGLTAIRANRKNEDLDHGA